MFKLNETNNQILSESISGKVGISEKELEENPNLTIKANCTCGFPLEVKLKENGKLMIKSEEEIKIKCFLCNKVFTISTKNI